MLDNICIIVIMAAGLFVGPYFAMCGFLIKWCFICRWGFDKHVEMSLGPRN